MVDRAHSKGILRPVKIEPKTSYPKPRSSKGDWEKRNRSVEKTCDNDGRRHKTKYGPLLITSSHNHNAIRIGGHHFVWDLRLKKALSSLAYSMNYSAQLDWHRELLLGLFLRSDERELEWLERETTSQRTSSVSGDISCDEKVETLPRENKGHGEIFSDGTQIRTSQTCDFLADLLPSGKTTDTTILSLVPDALRDVTSMLSEAQQRPVSSNNFNGAFSTKNGCGKDELNNFNREQSDKIEHEDVKEGKNKESSGSTDEKIEQPLLIPSSWRRPDYARRSLPELEQHAIDSGKGRVGRTVGKHGKNGSHPISVSQKFETHDVFTLLYNECSLSAMANWAMLDCSIRGPMDNDNGERWEKSKREREVQLATGKHRNEVMIPSTTFHLCGVCGGFGHYEAECEFLVQVDDEEHQNSVSKKRKRGQKNRTKKIALDKHLKNRAISYLSKEIHIQRRQRQLFENCCVQTEEDSKNEQNGLVASAALVPESSNTSHAQKEGEQGGKHQYAGKLSCCKICRSGFDEEEMLVCDGCDELFHCACLDPPLAKIPEGDWFCSNCISYDSDTSSVVEIEGFEDFVIEQRKRSVAEEAQLHSCLSLGQCQSSWTAAISLLDEQDPIIEDNLYLRKHLRQQYHQQKSLGQENGHNTKDFFITELCWAKRYDDRLDCTEWWPGMVTSSETRSLKMKTISKHMVQFFALDENAEIHETGILPFIPYCEYTALVLCMIYVSFETILSTTIVRKIKLYKTRALVTHD